MKYTILDSETTGLYNQSSDLDQQPSIVEIGAILVDDKHNVINQINTFVNPGESKFRPEATKVNGITYEMCKDAGSYADKHDAVLGMIRMSPYIVGCNPYFDIHMLLIESERIGKFGELKKLLANKAIVCVGKEYQHEFGYLPNLQQLYKRAISSDLRQTHRAMDDCLALLEVIKAKKLFDVLR